MGDSFADVPRTHPFYKPIETLFHNGVTTGCTQKDYCPDRHRDTLRRSHPPGQGSCAGRSQYPCIGLVNSQAYECAAGGASLFDDVAPTDFFCRHAHYLAGRNIMKACRPNAFCPAETISRVVMAVYVARAMAGHDNYVPRTGSDGSYSCEPASPNSHFADVPASNDFCKFVNYLWARGVVAGCGAGPVLPGRHRDP